MQHGSADTVGQVKKLTGIICLRMIQEDDCGNKFLGDIDFVLSAVNFVDL